MSLNYGRDDNTTLRWPNKILLILFSINLNASDVHGWTLPMKTCINGHMEVVKSLNRKKIVLNAKDIHGWTQMCRLIILKLSNQAKTLKVTINRYLDQCVKSRPTEENCAKRGSVKCPVVYYKRRFQTTIVNQDFG